MRTVSFYITLMPNDEYQLAIGDGAMGFRIGGPKSYGGSKTVAKFEVDEAARRAIMQYLDAVEMDKGE
jgi:cobalamin biosynthesis protein CobD/CbiB